MSQIGLTDSESTHSIAARYRREGWRRLALVALLMIVALLAATADLATGPFSLTLGDLLTAFLDPAGLDPRLAVVIYDVRLSQAATAALVGAALAISGAEMQTVLDNPLADPFTFGISAAASFGAALAIIANVALPFVSSEWLVAGNAFIFALGAVLLIQLIARWRGRSTETLVLVGIGLIFSFNAMTGLLEYVASEQALQRFLFWSMGSLTATDGPRTLLLLVTVILMLPFSLHSARSLTALRFGEDRAQSFGVDVARLRFWTLFRASLLAAVTVAVVGAIGFVGLVGPHIARLLIGEDHRFFLPASALTGAIIMSLSAIVAKSVVMGAVVPIGIVTSLVGLPVFFLLVLRRR